MHLRLLGRFELRHGDVEVRLAPMGERLLAYLALLDDAGLPATPSPALRRLVPLVSRVG